MNGRQILTTICTASIFLFLAGCNTPVVSDVEMLTPISDQSTPTITPSDTPGEKTLIIYDDDGSRDGMAALLYLLSIPEISIEAVNISYGEAHPEQYIQLIGYALESVGVLDVPLGAGQVTPPAFNFATLVPSTEMAGSIFTTGSTWVVHSALGSCAMKFLTSYSGASGDFACARFRARADAAGNCDGVNASASASV